MNRQAIAEFLDAYRDGIIDEAAARELATVIRQGGPSTDWILQELALSGWIAQALDSLDETTFVRCFLTRLYAERSSDEFSRVFTEKVAAVKNTPGLARASTEESRVPLFGWAFSGRHAESSVSSKRKKRHVRRPVFWRLAGLVAVLATVAALILIFTFQTSPSQAGTLLSASPGTAVSPEQAQGIWPGMPLRRNDRVSVPLDGAAVILANGDNRLELRSGAIATLRPQSDEPFAVAFPENTTILLDSGELTAERAADSESSPIIVVTPHATAEATTMSRFIITVTGASCQLEVDSGTVVFTRRRDGRTIPVTAGYSALATEADSFEVRPRP